MKKAIMIDGKPQFVEEHAKYDPNNEKDIRSCMICLELGLATTIDAAEKTFGKEITNKAWKAMVEHLVGDSEDDD